MSTYKKITIHCDRKNSERLYNYLYLFDIDTILEEDSKYVFYITKNFKKPVKELISFIKKNIPNIKVKIENFTNIDWVKKWESSVKPIYIRDKIVIYPSWQKKKIKDKKNLIKIEIDPKMSFGTGHNETTQMVLDMMIDYISPNDKFLLDFGTGSGILAIAAAKLGVREIIAIDNDKEAIKNAYENIIKNRASKKLTLLLNTIDSIKFSRFDVIIANITSDVIKKYFRHIYSKLKSNGKLILSGITKKEKNNFILFLKRKKMLVKEIKSKNDWVSIYCIKESIRNEK